MPADRQLGGMPEGWGGCRPRAGSCHARENLPHRLPHRV